MSTYCRRSICIEHGTVWVDRLFSSTDENVPSLHSMCSHIGLKIPSTFGWKHTVFNYGISQFCKMIVICSNDDVMIVTAQIWSFAAAQSLNQRLPLKPIWMHYYFFHRLEETIQPLLSTYQYISLVLFSSTYVWWFQMIANEDRLWLYLTNCHIKRKVSVILCPLYCETMLFFFILTFACSHQFGGKK